MPLEYELQGERSLHMDALGRRRHPDAESAGEFRATVQLELDGRFRGTVDGNPIAGRVMHARGESFILMQEFFGARARCYAARKSVSVGQHDGLYFGFWVPQTVKEPLPADFIDTYVAGIEYDLGMQYARAVGRGYLTTHLLKLWVTRTGQAH